MATQSPQVTGQSSSSSQSVQSDRANQLRLLQLLNPSLTSQPQLFDTPGAGVDRAGISGFDQDPASQAIRLRMLQNQLLSGVPSASAGGTIVRPEDGAKYLQLAKNLWRGENNYPKDHEMSVEMLKKSAIAEYSPALYQLGKLYLSGQGVLRDEAVGRTLLMKAKQLGLSQNESELRKSELLF
jgi:TPR repeat protein